MNPSCGGPDRVHRPIGLVTVLLDVPVLVPADPVITIDPDITRQEISGWEAVGWVSQEHESFPPFRDTAFDMAVNEAGLNRIRLEIRSGVENDADWWPMG